MGTIDEAIRQILDSVLENKAIYLLYEDRVALCKALNIMRKYQKIQEVMDSRLNDNDKSNSKVLSEMEVIMYGNN